MILGLVVVGRTPKVLLYLADCDFSNPSFPWLRGTFIYPDTDTPGLS